MTNAGEYRFALYGRSGAGKTCVLATIEMGAIGHSRKLTCEALPVEVAKPSGDAKSWSGAEQEAASLHAGKDWIVDAEGKLKSRELPEPNPPGGVTLAYRFILGSPHRGNSVIRTVDYAGELVNPNGLKEPESLAARLKRDLETYDGFLLVAETPPEGISEDKLKELNAELTRLRQSFAALTQSKLKLRTPVAVLLTKWDRYSTVDPKQPDQELDKLETFRTDARYSSYASLVESITTALAPQHDIKKDVQVFGLTFGNCAVFPATAFGQADQSGEKDKPPHHCQPFGVLEPFVWLADRRDQLDVEHLEQDWSSLRWQFWNPLAVGRVLRDSVRSSRRVPHKLDKPSALFQRVRRVKTRAVSLLVGVLFAWCGILLLAVGLAIGYWNRMEFQRQEAIVENTQATDEQLVEVRTWFDEYRLHLHGFFLAPSSIDAVEKIRSIDDTLDDRYWLPVKIAIEEVEKAKHARDYLTRLPNGRHATDARQIVAAREAALARSANAAWLADSVRQVESSVKSDTVPTWGTTLAECRNEFPHPAFVTSEQSEQRQNLVDHAARALVAAEKREWEDGVKLRWERFKKVYLNLLDSHSYKDAIEHLTTPESRSEDWQKLVKEFPTELHRRVEGQVASSLKANQFEVARRQLKSAVGASESLELVLRESHPNLANLILTERSKNLTPMGNRIDTLEDQLLYANVVKHRDVSTCDDYLKGNRPMPMKSEVGKVKDYLNTLNGPLSLTVSVFVTWDKNYSLGHDNIITVSTDDAVAFKTPAYVKDAPGDTSGVIGTFPLSKVKLRDAIKFSASIVEEDTFINDDGGTGTATFTVEELVRQQRSFPLRSADGSDLTNTLILKVTGGVEDEPKLPAWRRP